MNLPTPYGEPALAGGVPQVWGQGQWQGTGGGPEAARFYAWRKFAELFGRNPTESELSSLAPNYLGSNIQVANFGGGDQAMASYFQQQQAKANAPNEERQALEAQIPLISDLVNKQTQSVASDLFNPSSPTYQTFAGMMNNMGVTPSSGAFQAGMGGILGQSASQALQQALGSVGLPIASGYGSGAMMPYMSAMQRPDALFQNNLDYQNFLNQMIAGKQMAEEQEPGWASKYAMPLSSALISGLAGAHGSRK